MRRVEIREKLLCTVLRTVGVKYAGGPSKDLVVSKLQEWRASMDTVSVYSVVGERYELTSKIHGTRQRVVGTRDFQ